MTTQYTPILKLALPVTGELSGLWGDVVNDNITSMVEQAIAGLATINSWTANSHTLTAADGTTSESRCAMLVADDDGAGNPSAAAQIICPAATKLYVLKNVSGQTVTLKTSGGTGVAVPNNQTAFLFCDGTNVNNAVTTLVAGGTIDGNLSITGNVTLGDSSADTITANGRIASDLVPSTDNARDLGSAANSWKTLYLDTSALIANISIVGNTISSTDTNGNIVIQPNGTGDVQLSADTIQVGDSGATATITTNGAGDLVLNTNNGTSSGSVTIANGANGNITIQPNGTGDIYASADTLYVGDSGATTAITTNGGGALNINSGSNLTTFESPVAFTSTAATANGSLKFNTNAFVIDSTNKRIGVGVTNPAQSLHIDGSILAAVYSQNQIPFIHPSTAGLFVSSDDFVFYSASKKLSVNTVDVWTGLYASAVDSIGIGKNTLSSAYTGTGNTALGFEAIKSAGQIGNCTAIGAYSMSSSTAGQWNVAVGFEAMRYAITGVYNTAVGSSSLRGYGIGGIPMTGQQNTAIGYEAGYYVSTGSNNVCIGMRSGGDEVATLTTQSNYVVLGNNATTNANIKVSWTVTSDARDKTDIGTVPHGLDFVNQLKPVSYRYRKERGLDEVAEGARTRYGFLAQDILPLELNGGTIIDATDPDNLKFNESSLIPVLVNAIKELKAEVDALKSQIKGA